MATLDNLIDISFTPDEVKTITKALITIESVLKEKVINLTPEERQQYGSINNNTENWIDKIEGYMNQKPDLVPFYLDKVAFEKDRKARKKIKPMLTRIASINESLDDTSKLLSADIYNAAIAYYRNIKLISVQNVPGTTTIYQDLAEQFPGRPSSVSEEPIQTEQSNPPEQSEESQ